MGLGRGRWVALAMVLALLVAVPVAQAAVVSSHRVATSVHAAPFGGEEDDAFGQRIALLTGAMTWSASTPGFFAFSDADAFEVGGDVEWIDVFNQTAIDEARSARQRPTGPVSFSFTEATVSAAVGTSIAMVVDDVPIDYMCQSPFAVALPVELPDELFDADQATPEGPHLIVSGREQTCILQQDLRTTETYFILLDEDSEVTIRSQGESHTFAGKDWAFRITGHPYTDASADGIITPFKDPGATALLQPYGGADLADRFTFDPMQRLIDLLVEPQGDAPAPQQEQDDVGGAFSALAAVAPILDGVLLGQTATDVLVDGQVFAGPSWSLIRFRTLEAVPSADGQRVEVAGSARLILAGGEIYDTRSHVSFGPIHVPALAFVLWLVAVGAVIAAMVLKPLVGTDNVRSYGLIRLLGIAFWLLAAIAAFILFDQEVKALLGTSLLTLLVQGEAPGTAIALVAFFQLVPYTLAAVLFGLPMRIVTNSALKVGGLKSAKGVGKGVGHLALWGIGALYLRVLMGGFLGLALEATRGFGG